MEFEKKINPSNVAVKNYLENIPKLYSDLKDKSSKFKAGKVVNYSKNWSLITKDKEVLEIVNSGLKIETVVKPVQTHTKIEYKFSDENVEKINNQLKEMLNEEVISISNKEKD